MSKGLSVTVVYASSEDENYPASELTRAHSNAGSAPSKRGWQSGKLCEYPQEIGFRFDGEVELSQLQILAHQSKTPTKVEVFVASYDGTGEPPPYHRAEFHRLGYLTFHNNEHSKYRSRERKTVQLKQDACYLKLVLHRCHINPLNLYNQVSVMQVLAFGEMLLPFPNSVLNGQASSGPSSLPPVRRPGAQPPQSRAYDPDDEDVYHMLGQPALQRQEEHRVDPVPQPQDPYYGVVPSPTVAGAGRNVGNPRKVVLPPANTPQQPAYEPPPPPPPQAQPVVMAAPAGTMNGLAYYRSQAILDFERFYIERSKDLTTKKAYAVDTEDFDTAKSCKEQLAFLQGNAETIYDSEATKIRCIFDEDFDGAKRAKTQMDKLIAHTIQVLTAAKSGKPLNKNSTGTAGNDPSDGMAYGAPSAPVERRGHHRRRSSNIEMEDVPVDTRPPPADVKNFDEQPVMSKYAQKMAEDAKRRQHAEEEDHHSHPQRDEEGDEPEEQEEEEEEADEADDEHGDDEEEQDEEEAPQPKKHATPPPAPRKDKERSRHHRKHDHHEPDDDQHPHAQDHGAPDDDEGGAHQNEESAVAPSTGLRFELETFEEWERDVYFAIQDEASRDGTSEPPAEPLETTEGMTDFYNAFGHYTTACLFSRRWKLRDAAIRVVTQFLAVYFKHIITTNAVKAMLKYLDQKGYGLLDSIQAVYLSSCEFIVRLVEGRIQDAELASVQIHVQALLPRLFFRAADTNARSREEAITVIFLLANSSALGAEKVAAAALTETVDHDKRRVPVQNHRAFLSRLMVMQQLLTSHGLGKTISVDAIMTRLLLPCLNHQNYEVRDLAVVVAGAIDTSKGQEMMKYLPQVRNPATRAVIEEKLAFPGEDDGATSAEASPEKAHAAEKKPARSHSAKKRDKTKAAAPTASNAAA